SSRTSATARSACACAPRRGTAPEATPRGCLEAHVPKDITSRHAIARAAGRCRPALDNVRSQGTLTARRTVYGRQRERQARALRRALEGVLDPGRARGRGE